MFLSPTDRTSPRVRSAHLRRSFSKHRRLLASLLAGFACLIALGELRPPAPVTIAYLSASAALSAGHILTDADLAEIAWPEHLPAPQGLTDRSDIIGRTTAGPLAPGELVSESRLVSPGLLEIANLARTRGTESVVAAPVRLADPDQASLVRPGDLVDVLAARAVDGGGQSATLVAADAIVITIPGGAAASEDTGLMAPGGGSTGNLDGGHLIVLAVEESTAIDLAAASTRSQLSVVLKDRSRSVTHRPQATDLDHASPVGP